jgi:hypothetical protein
MFLRNVCWLSTEYMAVYPRGQNSLRILIVSIIFGCLPPFLILKDTEDIKCEGVGWI